MQADSVVLLVCRLQSNVDYRTKAGGHPGSSAGSKSNKKILQMLPILKVNEADNKDVKIRDQV
jgi:hypothetical protein